MKWVLIGASNIAQQWVAPAIRAVGDEIVGVVSGDAERARALATQLGISNSSDDLENMRHWGANAAYISSTNEKHEAQTLAAAALGLHVLCEKPLATELDAARRMAQACQDAGVTMGTNHHLRHNSAHLKMRDAIRAGELGALVALRLTHSVYLPKHLQGWRLDNPAAGGGVVLDIAVHNADSVGFLLDAYPTSVVAMVGNTGMAKGLEDNAMSVWMMESGVLVSTHQGFNTPHAGVSLEVHGQHGSLLGKGVLHQGPDGQLWRVDSQGSRQIELDHHNLYERCLHHFHLAIEGKPNDLADGWAGVRSLAVAQAVLKSAAKGQQVPVEW
jgi:1,5-anhydro-D-fructose reductase (1,5-anhydro-D-mannitol-forming)